jgi:hypothetical protein
LFVPRALAADLRAVESCADRATTRARMAAKATMLNLWIEPDLVPDHLN